MTKKMTVTLEESLIEELSDMAKKTGKKKAQIVREAMQDYFDTLAVTQTVQNYKMKIMEPISHKNVKALLGL